MEDYRTIRGTAVGEYEEKKSRFIAQLSFADSEEAAVAFLEQVRAANRTACLLYTSAYPPEELAAKERVFTALSDDVNSELDVKWSEMKSYDEGGSSLLFLSLLRCV